MFDPIYLNILCVSLSIIAPSLVEVMFQKGHLLPGQYNRYSLVTV